MYVRIKWLVLWSLWAARFIRQPTPVLQLGDGSLVRGVISIDGSHHRYTGIPYASSQYKNRFKAPGPAPKWDGVFEAIEENVRCPQEYGESRVVGTEDCLRINVYSPSHAWDGAPLPVMVFIHGGGFLEGSGTALLYGPDYLVTKGVVLVTFNYRLNVLGFLCLGTKEAPGNAGLKDQVAALKWVQRNIRAFGGDPDNVTIFGESAGSVSVSYHLISPMSKGLFHKAILQSGSSVAAWALKKDPVGIARTLAKVLGHNTKDPEVLYKIFMNTTISDLVSTKIPKKEGLLFFSPLSFTPCAEKEIDGVEPFLTDIPYKIYTKGNYNKVPVIIGSNDNEGYLFAGMENDNSLSKIKFEAILSDFDLEFPSEKDRRKAAQDLHKLYMGDDDISWNSILKLSRVHGEPYFNLPIVMETELLLKTSGKPVYSYLFKYNGRRNFPKIISGRAIRMGPGASHADDLFYLFNIMLMPSLFETKMIETMTTLWTNFAKYGTPTPPGSELQWPAATLSSPNRMELDASPKVSPVVQYTPTLQYWRELYKKYQSYNVISPKVIKL